MSEQVEDREAQAAREVGHTDVRPAVARALTGGFLLLLGVLASLEIARETRGTGSPWRELLAAPARAARVAVAEGPRAGNRSLLGAMTAFESALEERSLLTARALPTVQWVLTRLLGSGNEQVVAGRKGWLYFREAVDFLTGPGFLDPEALARRAAAGRAWEAPRQPDPVPALADFAAQLAERGIGLVVVPTPVKAALHPEALAPGLADLVPLRNPSFERFLARLQELEIPAYAPGDRLAEAWREKPWPLFLRTDTHWTPRAMEEAAAGLAGFLARHVALPERPRVAYARRQASVEGRGDLAALLRLPISRPLFPRETVLLHEVLDPTGEPWRPDPAADVLVLGDSFTNIYSQPELAWGEHAGFAEQLSYVLGRPLDKIAVNAGGPAASRERLAAGRAAGEDRLAGKRLVVYQFSSRELAAGDWRLVPLDPGRRSAGPPLPRPEAGVPARGWAAWESNRGGDWRIWTRRLEGSPARQLTPEEPGLQHCCPQISPDGSRLAYLSRQVPADAYPELEIPGELRLMRIDGAGGRTLAADARPYGWGNRAVVWRNDRELIYIDGEGRTQRLEIASGAMSPLVPAPRARLAWLLDPSLRHAVDGSPTFSAYDPERLRVEEGRRRPGCEPYFSHDGRFGFWVEGAGGPIRRIDLDSGTLGNVLEQDDRRVAGSQRYAYFPMLSDDGRLFAFGASAGDHDHFRSNYDVFVAPLAPETLELLGRPLRLTGHPAVDRYPDVHVESLDVARWVREFPPVPVATAVPAAAAGPLEARGVLRSCSRTPSLREISPYRAALVVCEWQLDEVLAGQTKTTRLRVAHWGLRDGVRQPIVSAAAGLEARLRLLPLGGAEQTEGYPVFNTLAAAPDLPLYYSRQP